MFVGGSTLLTYTYEVNETSKAQGFHDFVVSIQLLYLLLALGLLEIFGWVGRFWSNTIDDIYSYNFFFVLLFTNKQKYSLYKDKL